MLIKSLEVDSLKRLVLSSVRKPKPSLQEPLMFFVSLFLPKPQPSFLSNEKSSSVPLLDAEQKESSLTSTSQMDVTVGTEVVKKDDFKEIMERAARIADEVLSLKSDFEGTKTSYSFYDRLSQNSGQGQEVYLPLLGNLQKTITGVDRINKEFLKLKFDFSTYDAHHQLSHSRTNKKATEFQKVIRKIDANLRFTDQIHQLQSSITRKITHKGKSSLCCIIS